MKKELSDEEKRKLVEDGFKRVTLTLSILERNLAELPYELIKKIQSIDLPVQFTATAMDTRDQAYPVTYGQVSTVVQFWLDAWERRHALDKELGLPPPTEGN